MHKPLDAFLGLTEVGWAAVTAIGTLSLALLTLATVIFIGRQLSESRRSHVESLIDAGVQKYLDFRSKLYELDVKKSIKIDFDWDEFGVLRSTISQFIMLFSTVKYMYEIGDKDRLEYIGNFYVADYNAMNSIAKYSLEILDHRLDAFKTEYHTSLEVNLDEFGASSEEKKAFFDALERNSVEEWGAIFEALDIRYHSSKGESAQEYMKRKAREEADQSDAVEISKQHGLNHSSMALAGYWVKEMSEVMQQLSDMRGKITVTFGVSLDA